LPKLTSPTANGTPLLVRVEHLTKVFSHAGRRLEVLRGIDLEVASGEMLAISGVSGAGKSTLLNMIGALDVPTSGRVAFLGQDLAQMNPTQLAAFRNEKIGFVFQFHHLLPDFTALENVMMPALIHRLPRRKATARARDLLAQVGLAERTAHRPGELSGGEQQRVAVARAMIMKPALLLADEPTGNLDSQTGAEVSQLFVELNRAEGTTLVLVTHNHELAQTLPRTLEMRDGRLLDATAPTPPIAALNPPTATPQATG